MNKTTSMNHVLFWKEARQVTPLIAMLLGVGAILIFLWSGLTLATSNLAYAGRYLPLVLPALYAAGVGAVQIGQEKELRTIGWLSSLPISPQRLFWTKFTVALSGLAVMWISCGLLMALIAASGMSDKATQTGIGFIEVGDVIYFPLHSLFILACAMFSSWKFTNTFVSLLAIIPLAFIPLIVVSMVSRILKNGQSQLLLEQSAMLTWAVTALSMILLVWLTYRVACLNLAPIDPPSLAAGPAEWLKAWRPTRHVATPTEPFQFPISSLIWQSIHHNRWALAGIALLIAYGATQSVFVARIDFQDQLTISPLGLSALAGYLGVCWLGVFAFTGDGSQRGLRFLADRGASPTTVWCGRQWIGLCFLSCGILLYAIASLTMLHRREYMIGEIPSVATVAMVSLGVYAVSQWTSQLIRILAASALIAPLLSAVAIGWFAFAAVELNAPLWLLILCGVLPMLVSWSQMRRFMDSHRYWVFYLRSLGVIVPMMILPILPFAIDIARLPGMSNARRLSLLKEMQRFPGPVGALWELNRQVTPWDGINSDDKISGAEAETIRQSKASGTSERFRLNELDGSLPHIVHANPFVVELVLDSASFAISALRQSPADPEAEAVAEQWIIDLTRLGHGLRLSDRWQDQTGSDIVEIWLTQTLSSSPMNSMLERDFAKSAIALISDREGRNLARRRASLLSWARGEFLKRSSDSGYVLATDWGGDMSSTKRLWLTRPLVDRFITASLRLIDEGSVGHSTIALRRELHEIRFGSRLAFEDGPYSDRLRVGPSNWEAFSIDNTANYPAMNWYADWENEAAKLGQQGKK